MNIEYTWTVKHLNTDQRGYANTLYLELQGSNGEKVVSQNVVIAFGGSDYKPTTQWTQEEIDSYANTHEATLKDNLKTILEMQGAE